MKTFQRSNVLTFICLLLCSSAWGQITTVTGTVKDTNGLAYAAASVKAQLVLVGTNVTGQPTVTNNSSAGCRAAGFGNAPCQIPFQGTMGPITLDPTGSFTLNLQDNSQVTPASTQWLFTVNTPGIPPPGGTGPQACSATITITGASQSVSASFAACPALSSAASAATLTTLTVGTLNKVIYADQQAGATPDVKIANCLAALPSGGTCDARGFGATTQVFAATVTIPSLTTLLFDPATKVQAASSTVNMFIIEPQAILDGFFFDCGNLATYNGIVIQNDTAGFYLDGNKTAIRNLTIGSPSTAGSNNGSCASAAFTGGSGTAIFVQATTSTPGAVFFSMQHIRINGLANGIWYKATGATAFVNGNTATDVIISRSTNGWRRTANTGGSVDGNLMVQYVYEGAGNSSGIALFTESDGLSSPHMRYNQWYGASWDTTTYANLTAGSAVEFDNLIDGRFDGACTGTGCGFAANDSSFATVRNIRFADTSAAYSYGTFGGFWMISHSANGMRYCAYDLNACFHEYQNASGNLQIDKISVGTAMILSGGAAGSVTAGTGAGTFIGAKIYNNSGVVVGIPGTAGAALAAPYLGEVLCQTSQKSETAADANVLTCTPASAAGSYRIHFVMAVSAASAATLGWTTTYTDSNGNAQTPANLSLSQLGVAAPALTFTTSTAGNYYGDAVIDVNNTGTAIIIKLTFSGTSFTAKVSATIERII